MSSILTNNGAMVALQTLKGINSNMAKTQSEISTGKSVANAKDNAAIWATAKIMETDESSFKAIRSQLNVAESTVATGRAGAEKITKLLGEMRDLAASASNDTADHGKVNTDILGKRAEIESIVNASQFNGINLLKTDIGNGGPTFSVLASLDRGTAATTTARMIDVTSVDFEADIVGGTVAAITDKASAQTAIGQIEALINTAVEGAASLGSAGKRITGQSEFVGQLADSLKSGIGSMVDADMEETSARLQALQVQQQLATQSLSIANQAPQSLLSLFRG
ncbi:MULTISPECIES: flagellin [unclassified Paracoccus (in: a-proteobacteria)]|uniref:flagellin N-terminal helical domain-containing protein n=1 Tax=unclassified Paracoccus (in: a-proteobacteria) TaxID=2688777 RepID=UPI0016031CEC|nr:MULTISPECIES: flagellin [unclassified Paracoccus (in: a-proteobacteria)]MBB1491719.1 flagellin [Paracoccus sp. MC1854]MBB1499223.1 flagellin [Paracoccus sp. MC1862]QQO46533.1 flagellin [Paracoccus sp. MC1862]